MYRALNQYLRGNVWNGFKPRARRLACAALLALLLPAAVCAYTVVLRGGRRIEIPANFTVTKLTLTYETAPGINVTLLMSTIDAEATERANNEPAGALFRRAEGQSVTRSADGARRARPLRRELTKQDIEAARRARTLSESEYERRRIELGLPSLEETRRNTEAETRRLAEEARATDLEQAEAESYWRSRSGQLRTEIAALDAQINYVRTRLAEIPETPALGAYGFITGAAPVFSRRHPVTRFPAVTGNPGFMRADITAAPVNRFPGYGGLAARSQIILNGGPVRFNYGRRGRYGPGIVLPPAAVYGLPYANYDYSGERATLVIRLRELETTRAGLQARWRSLEEEARRAGALPGWLRP